MKTIYISAACLLVSLALVALVNPAKPEKPGRPNVLFIFVDDLRPDLGCYGNREVVSPHMDAFAKEAAVFNRHYVVIPTCGASRYSLLTGKLPRTVAQLDNNAFETMMAPNTRTNTPESFVDLFRRNGYRTVGIGKVSHAVDGYIYGYNEEKGNRMEMPQSWDEMLLDAGKWKTGWNAFFGYADGSSRTSKNGAVKPYESGNVDDDGYVDGLSAKLAVGKLDELAKSGQPFFLGVGFFRPHLPFNSPQKYWDLYDEKALSLTPSPNLPENVNPASLQNSGEFNSYKKGGEIASLSHPVSDDYARKLRHGYYASVSYTDAQIGKVLDRVKALNLDKNTIVVIWGDHGWHLGDYRVWGKHTIFERGLRSVLIMKAPGMVAKGRLREEVVSSADIYPTLAELCNLPKPEGLDGKSLTPLLLRKKYTWNNLAYGYFNKGISVRNERYRYTRYLREGQPTVELYDHETDPFENINVAESRPEIVKQMEILWKKGDTGLYHAKN